MIEPANEEYRRAAFTLASAVQSASFGSVLFSSATAGEGVTSAVLQIGRHLMGAFKAKPLIIELNRLRPAYSRLFGLDESKSLVSISSGARSAHDCIQRDPTGLPFILAGSADQDMEGGLGLETTLCKATQELQNEYDMILIDAPPILDSVDVLVAGRIVQRLILVVGAGQVSKRSLSRAILELNAAKISLIGTILNAKRRIIPGWAESMLSR